MVAWCRGSLEEIRIFYRLDVPGHQNAAGYHLITELPDQLFAIIHDVGDVVQGGSGGADETHAVGAGTVLHAPVR